MSYIFHGVLIRFFFSSLAVYLTSWVTGVGVPHDPVRQAVVLSIVVAAVLGLINVTIKPIISIVTIPINFVTLGLFSFLVNAVMILIASYIVPGFVIPSFLLAIVFAVVLSIINSIFHMIEGDL